MDFIKKVIFFLLFIIYNVFVFLLIGVIWIYLIFSKSKSFTLRGYLRRFFSPVKDDLKGCILFHVSSLGEINAVSKVIEVLKSMNKKIVISVFTETAYSILKSRYNDVYLMPFDFYPFVKLFAHRISPSLVFIAETEIWPSYIMAFSGAKIIWINARMSEKNYRKYSLIKFFLRYLFKKVFKIFVQTKDDFKRFSQFTEPQKVEISGNTKYDVEIPKPVNMDIKELICKWKDQSFSLIGGSIHPDEFEYLVKAFILLRNEDINIKFLVVPRHIEKTVFFKNILSGYKLDYIVFSEVESDRDIKLNLFNFMIFDKTGYLSSLYELFEIAFVGGTLNMVGGHNLLEPAFFSKPVLFGPHYELQKTAAEKLLETGGGFKVSDEYDIKSRIKYFFYDRDKLISCGKKAYQTYVNLSGATRKILDFINIK